MQTKHAPKSLNEHEVRGTEAADIAQKFTRPKLLKILTHPEFKKAFINLYKGTNPQTGSPLMDELKNSEWKTIKKQPEEISK